jgi:DNA-3-methyladenine glycosylase
MKKLPRSFYDRNTIEVAVGLLGCHLICIKDGTKTGGMIVETEAYRGPTDPACHAFKGRTKRNDLMYGMPGFLYVYFTYGNHFMLNVVTENEGFPAAVLLRALEPFYGIETMAARRGATEITNIASGPGKMARALGITGADYGTDLTGPNIYLTGPPAKRPSILASPRIGINGGSERLWRFFIKDNLNCSRGSKWIRDNSYDLAKARKMKFMITG